MNMTYMGQRLTKVVVGLKRKATQALGHLGQMFQKDQTKVKLGTVLGLSSKNLSFQDKDQTDK